jgi:hypothetical protein
VSAERRRLAALLSARAPDLVAALESESTVANDVVFDAARFETVFAALGRRLGTDPLGGASEVTDRDGRTWSIDGWGLDEVARAFLLVAALPRVPAAEQKAWLEDSYRTGALRERRAVLRALPLLAEPDRFLPIALDAGRSSTQPIFEAIACENPYPAAYFPEASFNQLIMKAVFTEVPLARILGLMSRHTPELARMAGDYASERRAAGRTVPPDLALLIDP